MPFPKRLLLEGELVALDFRPHWWFFAGPLSAGIPVLVMLVLALKQNGDVQRVALLVTAVVALGWAVWLASRLIRWQLTHFVVTNERIVLRSGVLAKHSRDIPLDRITDLRADQTFFERMIGAGDLLIESGGEHGQETFNDIPHPDAVKEVIYQHRNAKLGGRATAVVPAAGSISDEIEKLARLRDRGDISVDEYEVMKAQLLDRR